MVRATPLVLALALTPLALAAQDSVPDHAHMDHAAHHQQRDTTFASLQRRGAVYMGVDQTTTAHRFDALPDGGRIELQSLAGDSTEVAAIRQHFQNIAGQFARGDFATPFAVHEEKVPGTEAMTARRDRIAYELSELPRGAALRLKTRDREALEAIHAFMAYQRKEHHAPGEH
jgi:hypothetical protein